MLSNRTSGQPSRFLIPNKDDAGEIIVATSASWELFDARGVSIDAGVVADFDPDAANIDFTVDAASLTLTAGATSDGREIVVFLTTADGEIELRDYFLLVESKPLSLMVNSLLTYPEALAIRQGFGPVLNGWDATTDITTRASALAQAYEHLMRMRYRITITDPLSIAQSHAAYGTGTDDIWSLDKKVQLRGLSLADFDALPADFRTAVKRAQLVEADVLLGGDVVGKKRRDGIISETIGESSTFFNSKPYLNLPVSRQAFEELKRFVIIRIGSARG